jgi:hypothetical protein
MSFENSFEYYVTVAVPRALANHPEWRPGQAYFNVLLGVANASLAEKVEEVGLDPYYTDSQARIDAFLEYVETHWEN